MEIVVMKVHVPQYIVHKCYSLSFRAIDATRVHKCLKVNIDCTLVLVQAYRLNALLKGSPLK